MNIDRLLVIMRLLGDDALVLAEVISGVTYEALKYRRFVRDNFIEQLRLPEGSNVRDIMVDILKNAIVTV